MDKTNHAYNDGSNNDGEILLGDRGTIFVIKKSCWYPRVSQKKIDYVLIFFIIYTP